MQSYYDGDLTARSKLYAIWDDDDDDTDDILAGICKCSPATVNTYRQDYRRAHRGDVISIAERELPVVTVRGTVMWSLPIDDGGNRSCEKGRCEMWEACRWWVHHGGFIGCERLLGRELEEVE